MKFQLDKCPECGKEPVGTISMFLGVAKLMPDDQGGYEYPGDTEICWGTPETVVDGEGRVPLQC